MKIWLLSSEFTDDSTGGIARYIDNYARLLGKSGHEVLIITLAKQAQDKIIAPGVRLIGIVPHCGLANRTKIPHKHLKSPYSIMPYWPAFSYQIAEKVLDILQRFPSPDIIESQEYNAIPYFLLQRKLTEEAILKKIPIIVHLHSPHFQIAHFNQEPRYKLPQYWIGQMEKFCIISADALVCPSYSLARSVEKLLNRSLDIKIIPYPFISDNKKEILSDNTQSNCIVYVGRLEARKGIPSLVSSCSDLWASGEDFKLVLIGGDTKFLLKNTTMAAFIKKYYTKWIKTGNLKLLGELKYSETMEHIQKARAVIIPSVWDNFPNVCLEAMGLGQIVLASKSGGQAEIIESNGVDGFLFDWDKKNDFEEKLIHILKMNDKDRNKMCSNARRRIQILCDSEKNIAERIEYYQKIVAAYKPKVIFPTINNLSRNFIESRISVSEKEQKGLVSVIIPYYNLGDYIEEALHSVLSSSYSPIEVIIVNDGSDDTKSIEVLKKIENKNLSNTRILHTKNQGLALTRNIGAEKAGGEFIVFVDADDMVEPHYFSKAVYVLQRYENVDLVYSWMQHFEESKGMRLTWNAEFPYILGHNMISQLAVIRRHSFLKGARNKPDIKPGFEDYESWIELLKQGGVGVSLPFCLVRYRVRKNSMHRSTTPNSHLYVYELITQHHPELYEKWGEELFHLQNANGPGRSWQNLSFGTRWYELNELKQFKDSVYNFLPGWLRPIATLLYRKYIQKGYN
ncbi:MAG: glycosyltransferase [Candidatus Omnitrophica bacterium]|nr:glycosyltransferase [Candidatus Omnitrophota bacterium]